MRNFILVTAIKSTANTVCSANGIRKLRRRHTISDFISNYLLNEVKINSYSIFDRAGTIQCTANINDAVYSYSFTQYPETELISAVSNLSKEEVLRDLKELLPIKAELL